MGEAISPRVRLFPLRVRLFQDITSPWAPVGAKNESSPVMGRKHPHIFRDSLDRSSLVQLMGGWSEASARAGLSLVSLMLSLCPLCSVTVEFWVSPS